MDEDESEMMLFLSGFVSFYILYIYVTSSVFYHTGADVNAPRWCGGEMIKFPEDFLEFGCTYFSSHC